ncbi:Mth938-like domain-containing protein [Parvibium lacunae]|uniref:Xcc1710-like domain-containing protein n=1 Tax=Parvibium lacunae TaxID=1888893 RepID=A0A368L835_9BURK|nr:Mth938-like domain-containing protein [Parvibium lacunae]RCS59399.1 hypothetical protein DU000_01300 [Parvibium lacunae]
MKLHADTASALNTITAYDVNYLEINQQRYPHSLFLHPRHLESWAVQHLDQLAPDSLDYLADTPFSFPLEVILLGTGRRQRFPHPRLLSRLHALQVGVEIMDTQAACRTYNILMSEGRQVAAALILESDPTA